MKLSTRSNAKPSSARLRTPWGWAGLGLALGLLVASVAFAPAQWLTSWIEQSSQQRLRFHAVRGSIWDGSAQLSLSDGTHSQATLPARLAWRLQVDWGHASLNIQANADCCMRSPWEMQLRPRWGGYQLQVADSQAQWPAAWLTGLGTPWNTLALSGPITIATKGLVWDVAAQHATLRGQVQIDALALSSRLTHLHPMGSYRLRISGGATPELNLQTLSGDLLLSGHGLWLNGRLHFEGEASAQAQSREALANLLNILGQRNGARTLIRVG